jgi:hypothetical protein
MARRGYPPEFRQPGQREWWSEWHDLLEEDFQQYVDGLIREGEAAG